ncbi:MAG TPA: polysaccharide deacetylase family protein [Candidatus Methylomirabilis sp.]|nr:polysaccharide deacetylase family protein [Candidatus Methylomirabilis sp.]
MPRGPCATHPQVPSVARCFRCLTPVCRACRVRAHHRSFCARGCSAIYLLQRAAAEDWRYIRRAAAGPSRTPWGRIRAVLDGARFRLRRTRLDEHLRRLKGRVISGRAVLPRLRWFLAPAALVALALLWLFPSPPPPEVVVAKPLRTPSPVPPLPGLRALVPSPGDRPGSPVGRPPDSPPEARPEPPSLPPSVRPGPSAPGRPLEVSRGLRSRKEVALTFDGGSDANVSSEILDILQARGVRATLFLTGGYIRRFPDLVRRMVAEGHEVANHTDSHRHLTTFARNRRHDTLPGLTREIFQGELRRAEAAFRAVTGQAMRRYWRAPYGEVNRELLRWAAGLGYTHVGWTRGEGNETLDTRDWVADRSSRLYASSARIRDRILGFDEEGGDGAAGGIVLMHLASRRRDDPLHRRLDEIIDGLRARGYALVPVSDLLREDGEESAVGARRPERSGTLAGG